MIKQTTPSLDYYVWLMSDWAYLGHVRFSQMAARRGISVNYIPMRMQDVYAGSGGIVLEKRSWQRRTYRIEELKRWSERLGMRVNIEPAYFPVDVDVASCMVVAAQRRGLSVDDLTNAMMRAIWVEDENLADRDTLLRIAERTGYDAIALLEAAAAPAVRQEYTSNTTRALEAGVFGSPFYVFNGERFWGQDRLDMLEDRLAGSKCADLGRRPNRKPLVIVDGRTAAGDAS
jgi:2-hydroxychromene-2-carboxylate isomerase